MSFKKGMKLRVNFASYNLVKGILLPIFNKYNCIDKLPEFIDNRIFFILEGKYNQLMMINTDNINLLSQILKDLSSINFYPYSIGVPIVTFNSLNTKPTIALGRYLVNICKNKVEILDPQLIYKIIYGKSIIINSKKLYNDAIIVDNKNNFIAYAKLVQIDEKRTRVIPIKDIGWYLRRGG